MKSMMLVFALALVPALGGLHAQTVFEEPSAESVLQTARDMYNQATGSSGSATGTVTPAPAPPLTSPLGAAPAVSARAEYPYSPLVIGFAPLVHYPFGLCSTNLALSAIGSSVGDLYGLQAAGIFSSVEGQMQGGQFSGIFNLAEGNVDGIQAAGIFNSADGHVRGLQMAGIFNTNRSFDGLMAAGIINATGQGRGVMVGLINVADEFDGVAIGLVNLIGNGVHDVALDYQFDSKMLYTTLRSGTAMLYATVSAAEAVDQLFTADDLTRSVGFGLGHRLKVLFLTVDAELGYELMNNMAGVADFLAFMATGDLAELDAGVSTVQGFGSARFSFNLGRPGKTGLSFGVKVDFGSAGLLNVPAHLRYSFLDSTVEGTVLFGQELPFWPKLFLGIRF